MNRKIFKSNKTGKIFSAFLLSIIIAFVPTTSAGIINIPPLINVTYPVQDENVVPNSGVLDIPLETTFFLTGPWARFAEKCRIGNSVLQIELKIIQKPDYCTASISNPLANIAVGEDEPYRSVLTATVNENAPAFHQAVVRISATSKLQRGLLFNIAEETAEFDVSFNIGYWSVVSYEIPNGTLAEIGPSDTVDFPIYIENLGNGPTKVDIELMDYPEKEWDVNITSSVQLSSGINDYKNSREQVHLKIIPKNSKNWKNKIETFGVRFSPSYLGRPELQGQQEIINFNVKKIGQENEERNLEIYYLIILIVIIILIILGYIILKRRYLLYAK
jgi:hypothetical protein